jgi:hypothetical protein
MLRNLTLAGIFALALPSFALADGDGAVKGAVGGAVAGALWAVQSARLWAG